MKKLLFLSLFITIVAHAIPVTIGKRIAVTATKPVLPRYSSIKTFPPLLKQHIQQAIEQHNIRPDVLEKSDRYLQNVDGYQHLLYSLVKMHALPHFCKGYLFELETALALCEQEDAVIEYFHYLMHRPKSEKTSDKREIDIVSNQHITECKNYNWNYVNRSNLKKQLGHQHSILKDYNAYYGTTYKHLFCSKNVIPNWFTQWLFDHNIEYRQPN